jgi:hypothetical protein
MLSTQINNQYYMSFNPHQYSAEHHDGARELKGRMPINKLQGGMKTKHEQDIILSNQVTQHNIDKQKEMNHDNITSNPSAKTKKSNSKTIAKSTVKAKVANTNIKIMKPKTSTKTVLKGVGAKPTMATKKVATKASPKATKTILKLS